MASGVVYYDREGKEHFQGAEVVIIACNGVGTPRLMLNSVSGKFPNGIANSSGLVGRISCCIRMHRPTAMEEPLDGNHGQPLCLRSQEFTRPIRSVISSRLHLPVRLRRSLYPGSDRLHQRRPAALGQDHHKVYRRLMNHQISMSAISGIFRRAQPRDAGSELERFRRHSGPKVDDTIEEQPEIMEHGSPAPGRCCPPPAPRSSAARYRLNGGWHLLGTARMGTDPERSW